MDSIVAEQIEAPTSAPVPTLTSDVETATSANSPEPMTQRRVLGLAFPIIGENLLQTAVSAVNTFMVARLGAAAVAGVGIGFEVVFLIISVLSAIDVGATVLVAQSIGAGDKQRADLFARQAIVWGVLLSIPVSVLMYFAAPVIVGLFGTEPEVASAATIYLEIVAATSISLFMSFVAGAVLRGAGDSHTPLAASLIANIVNVIVNYLLIFGQFGLPTLGVAGAAWGATIGRGCGAIFMLVLMIAGKRAISMRGTWGWRPDVSRARELFRLGLPAAAEQVLSSGGFTTLIAVVALIGTSALAAQQIAFTALSLAFLPGVGFSITATALVGQSIGARSPQNARRAWQISLRWAFAWMGIGAVLVFFLSERLMRIFSSDPEVIATGATALRALSFALPWWAIWFVSSGSLRGSGDTRTPLIFGATSIWLAVLLGWVGVKWFDAGIGWVWFAFVLTTGPVAIIAWWSFRKRLMEYDTGHRELPAVTPSPA
ncbi:MAG: MATE family efflux transporter [Thermomicrobiales bacterium]